MSSADLSSGRTVSWCTIVAVVAALLHLSSELRADSFVMKSGNVIDGSVARGSDISVFIKDEIGLLKSITLTDVAEVKIDLRNDEQVVGRLVGFRDDVHEVLMEKWTLHIKDGRVVRSVVAYDGEAPAIISNAGGPAIGVDTQDVVPVLKSGSDDGSGVLKRAPM